MSSLNVVYEKIHYRHDPRWLRRLGPAASCSELCVACAIEMMESDEVSSVRKSGALISVCGVLKRSPGVLKDVLLQDHRVCLHFIASLLGMLHTVKDEVTLEQTAQVLVQLLLELQNEKFVHCVLQEIHTQQSLWPAPLAPSPFSRSRKLTDGHDLCEQAGVRGFLPTFTFVGKLLDAVPGLGQTLASQHVPLLEQLCVALQFPDEALKSSVCYIFIGVWGYEGAGQTLPPALRDRLCALLLQTLSSATTPHLTVNCLGFLRQLLRLSEAVSVLMNCHSELDSAEDPDLTPNAQPPPKPCSLPLILKKVMLSGEEVMQVASAQAMTAVLVQSPSQYCPLFIQADIPEFLYERLVSRSEVLLWSVYNCLLLLMEDPLFFSQCHSVYGIESLIRSLKEALRMNNQDVQRQGLLLLTETLEKQPAGVRLFPSGPGFGAVAEVVVAGVSAPCLQVGTQAACAAAALFRLNHQSSPVLYKELKRLVEAVIGRCTELPLPTATHRRAAGSLAGAQPSTQYSRAGAFLLQALVCFHAACRLAEQCAGDPDLEENVFTAPDSSSEESLQSFCLYLLHSCDSVCIPTITRHCERASSAAVLEQFFSVLSCLFSLVPSRMPLFSNKLASSGFFRLTLERKAAFCAGHRNPALNTACSDFLRWLSLSLLSQLDTNSCSQQQECEEVGALLERCLPALCCRPAEWPSLLCEAPGPAEGQEGPGATQHCLLILLYLALRHGDRLLPDAAVFSSVVAVLRSVQEQGGRPPSPCVLRAALYLLSVTQDSSPELDWAPLNCITAALSSCPSASCPFSPPHPALLRFVFRYPELADRFGPAVLELWLTRAAGPEVPGQGSDHFPVLLPLVEKNPAALLSLLGVMCSGESRLASHALETLRGFLLARPSCDPALSNMLRPLLLQVLQRLAVEGAEGPGVLGPVPLVLQLLVQLCCSVSAPGEMDSTDFKLLYHVSNLAGKLKASSTESLLPALNFLYCSVGLCPPHCANRAVSILLGNDGLMDQLQMLLDICPSSSSSSSSLLGCSRLLLSTLVHLQHVHSAQVHKRITLSLDSMVHLLCFRKRKTDGLSLASALRLLQTALDVDLQSPLLDLTARPSAQRPLLETEAALHPLGSHRAQCLTTALYSLLLEKQELLLIGSVSCLRSLLVFLGRRSPDTALHMVCQPWSRFLLFSLLSCGGASLLHPAVLQLLELVVRFNSKAVLWEPDLVQVLEAAESRELKDLEGAAAQALRQLLTQLLGSPSHPPPTQKHRERAQSLLDSLESLPPVDAQNHRIVRVGKLSVCLSDFTMKTRDTGECDV
ncbi:hypothetical protein COCON_G00209400 [Conger conger]|uniref:Meiosis inhibitor protein 1 n=1 Tax=Conger conger TaxID=82655 RepID=A0A9Q1D0T8_CONCO|nr:hypothetical protein COCON_G00209400 [Conger conger]